MEEKKAKLHWFGKFTLLCILFAFSPFLVLLICLPYFTYHGCKSGATVSCTDPSVNAFASDIYGLGAWGVFMSVPAAICLWAIVGVIALIAAKPKKPNGK